jgi:hypothetical protein
MKLLFALSLLVTANTLAVPPPRSAVQATPSEPTQVLNNLNFKGYAAILALIIFLTSEYYRRLSQI